MPVIVHAPVRRLTQAEFGEVAYGVMGCVFEIHRDLGRFFDEKIYKRELARRYPGVRLEVPIEITHGTFQKMQYMDLLVGEGGIFEFKAADSLVPRHPAQLLHYMLLADLGHGKLVNLGNSKIEHEFVNATLRREDRVRFKVIEEEWYRQTPGAASFQETLESILRVLEINL